jgi:hypothetical protein
MLKAPFQRHLDQPHRRYPKAINGNVTCKLRHFLGYVPATLGYVLSAQRSQQHFIDFAKATEDVGVAKPKRHRILMQMLPVQNRPPTSFLLVDKIRQGQDSILFRFGGRRFGQKGECLKFPLLRVRSNRALRPRMVLAAVQKSFSYWQQTPDSSGRCAEIGCLATGEHRMAQCDVTVD